VFYAICISNTLKKHKHISNSQFSKRQYLAPMQIGIFPSLVPICLVSTDKLTAALQGQTNRTEYFSCTGPTMTIWAQWSI